MNFPEDQIKELKTIAPSLSMAEEGGFPYFLMEKISLLPGCIPKEADVLLCPVPRDGYNSRLYFSAQITGVPTRNWNGNIRVLDRTWYAISWSTPESLRLSEMLMVHLRALRV